MKICNSCVLPETYPGITFDAKGVCHQCHDLKEKKKQKPQTRYFQNEADLIDCLQRHKKPNTRYDVLVPVSGGVDSCSALIQVKERFNLKPLAFHNDHGYEDETATRNVQKLCKAMDVDLVVWQHDIDFMKKLWRYLAESGVYGLSGCFFCGYILYLNALELAHTHQIQMVINGFTKGQASLIGRGEQTIDSFGELVEHITRDKEFFREFIRKNELLNRQRIIQEREDFEREIKKDEIMIMPFFMFDFYKSDKEQLKKICIEKFDWQPMKTSYPNRTTNCDMVWLNSFMDLQKMGYTVYHEEYSTLIRLGEITREQVLKDLYFEAPAGILERLAKEVGLDENWLKKSKEETHSTKNSGPSGLLKNTMENVDEFEF